MALSIEYIALGDLKHYENNARTHSHEQVEQLVNSINEFGFTNPVLIDEDNVLIAGHGRTAAASLLGLDQVPAIRLKNLSEQQKKALRIADNQLALNAGWDLDLLASEVIELQSLGFDIDLLAFDDDFLNDLLADSEDEEGVINEDGGTPDPKPNPVSNLGDIWVLGRHRVMCGDSTSSDDVDSLMQGQKAGLIFTDPPYGVSYQSGMSNGGTSSRFDALANDDVILDIAPIVWSFMDDDTAAFIWTSHHVYPVWRKQFDEFYKQTIIWHKPGGGIGDLYGSYGLDYEMALFCVKGRPVFRGGRGMAVWTVSKDSANNYVHPTQKPVGLAERAIHDFSDNGDIVLDLFGGSGSTLIAGEKNNRKCRLMELDPLYADVIIRRWQELTGKSAVLESTGEKFRDLDQQVNGSDL